MSKPKYDAIMLRCCSADGTSRGGFRWPKRGYVECTDWTPAPVCGGGLHGLAWGTGKARLISGDVWQAVRYRSASAVDLGGKIKIPHGYVAITGSREQVTQYIYERAPAGTVIHYLSLTGGDRAVLTGGDDSTLTAGDRSVLTAGDLSTLTAGDRSVLTAGDRSVLTAGHRSTLTGGAWSTLTAGIDATLTAGEDSVLTASHRSTLTGGNRSVLAGGEDSVLTAGEDSVLTGGDRSTLTGGEDSVLAGGAWSTLTWCVLNGRRYRLHTVYVGEDGIEPDRPYTWRDGAVVEVKDERKDERR